MAFFSSAIDTLQTLVIALGAGLGVWAWLICWRATARITRAPMLMCHKVTHKNLIDSSPLFRYYLTHTPCNFFVKPIDSDTSEEI